jgi:hypothetical protein
MGSAFDSPSPVSLRETSSPCEGEVKGAALFPSSSQGEDGLRSKPSEGKSRNGVAS